MRCPSRYSAWTLGVTSGHGMMSSAASVQTPGSQAAGAGPQDALCPVLGQWRRSVELQGFRRGSGVPQVPGPHQMLPKSLGCRGRRSLKFPQKHWVLPSHEVFFILSWTPREGRREELRETDSGSVRGGGGTATVGHAGWSMLGWWAGAGERGPSSVKCCTWGGGAAFPPGSC